MIYPIVGGDVQIYGNEFTGATSGDKRDHVIYVGYGSDNIDIGWNNFHDNNIAEGPIISINTDYAVNEHYKFENIRVHDNVMDCRKSSTALRAIGVVATDYGSTVYIYNNTFIGGGYHTVYMYSGQTYIYNNDFFDSNGTAAIYFCTVNDAGNYYKPGPVEIKNNIFYVRKGTEYLSISNENEIGSDNIRVSNNNYYGNGDGPSRDSKPINADPLFRDPWKDDFHLLPNSPCIGTGSGAFNLAPRDKDGLNRPRSGVAIGAYEYTAAVGSSAANGGGSGNNQVTVNPDGTLGLRVGDVVVLGSKAGRGTVNPDKGDTAQICYQGSERGTFECRIFTLTGEQVWQTTQNNVNGGIFDWKPDSMASGIYIAFVKGPGVKKYQKIAVLR
jgi:hypothetical protein